MGHIKRYDKNNASKYNISIRNKAGVGFQFANTIYTYDSEGNFYFGSSIYSKDTLLIGLQKVPIYYSDPNAGTNHIVSLDSVGNVRYFVPNSFNFGMTGCMKIGKDKNLYVYNGRVQKINSQGRILWTISSGIIVGGLDVDDSCNVFVFGRRGAQDAFMKLDSSGRVIFQKNLLGRMNNPGPYSILSFPKTNEFYIS